MAIALSWIFELKLISSAYPKGARWDASQGIAQAMLITEYCAAPKKISRFLQHADVHSHAYAQNFPLFVQRVGEQ